MKLKDWSKFKIYCSAISRLMSRPRGANDLNKKEGILYESLTSLDELTDEEQEKLAALVRKREVFLNPPLSESAKTCLIDIYSRQRYGVRTAAISKMRPTIAKGYFFQKEGAEILTKVDKVDYTLCKDFMEDDYFYGVPDILCKSHDKIIDIKTSWNAANFMLRRKTPLSASHWWQLQGYMHLFGISKGQVAFVLINTPMHLIQQELDSLFMRYVRGEINREKYDVDYEKLESLYNFDKIPISRRTIRYEVEYNKYAMTQAMHKVDLSREFLAEFEIEHVQNRNIVTSSEKYVNGYEDDTEHNATEPLQSD
jgi:hypothetical protein